MSDHWTPSQHAKPDLQATVALGIQLRHLCSPSWYQINPPPAWYSTSSAALTRVSALHQARSLFNVCLANCAASARRPTTSRTSCTCWHSKCPIAPLLFSVRAESATRMRRNPKGRRGLESSLQPDCGRRLWFCHRIVISAASMVLTSAGCWRLPALPVATLCTHVQAEGHAVHARSAEDRAGRQAAARRALRTCVLSLSCGGGAVCNLLQERVASAASTPSAP